MPKTAVILDTEFTTWEGAMATNWGEDWQHREIVQFGAVKIDTETLKIIEKFDKLVQPKHNPELSDFFVELTGITREDVAENGRDFETVYKDFIGFADGDQVYCYGWDGKVIAENCELLECQGLVQALDFTSLHSYFQEHGVDTAKVNSGALAKHFNVPLEIHEHNAMDDVYSICAGIKHLKGRGHVTPFEYYETKKAS
tara:strand:+ start:118 stop:714 length:597 start_codon:yes stop_codon:yes gene_type:complete